jgi:3D (Asp-Asp-Asp) domain-containing protein/peptidoglycan hydrolase CwlO-like protein
VRWRRESRLALGLALAVGLLLGASLPGARGADPQTRADDPRRHQRGLTTRSHGVLLSLYALDSRLAQARGEIARLRKRVQALTRERESVQSAIAIVERNLHASQRLLADRLRTLYQEGSPDAIAVFLGATSLDAAVTRLDELERGADQGAQAARDARLGRARLQRLSEVLAARLSETRQLEARAERTAAALEATRAERVAYIASLERQRRLNAREIASLDSQARRVVERAQAVQSQVGMAPASGSPLVAAFRSITVTATGYSLPGRTATGLPVGPGIIAVDPAVIPLGTWMTIPGYGEGVAADTGGAVQGYTIDLWFPTVADALAWGRRTVTIVLH